MKKCYIQRVCVFCNIKVVISKDKDLRTCPRCGGLLVDGICKK